MAKLPLVGAVPKKKQKKTQKGKGGHLHNDSIKIPE